MKKMLAIISTLTILGTTTLSVISCEKETQQKDDNELIEQIPLNPSKKIVLDLNKLKPMRLLLWEQWLLARGIRMEVTRPYEKNGFIPEGYSTNFNYDYPNSFRIHYSYKGNVLTTYNLLKTLKINLEKEYNLNLLNINFSELLNIQLPKLENVVFETRGQSGFYSYFQELKMYPEKGFFYIYPKEIDNNIFIGSLKVNFYSNLGKIK